MTLRRAFLALAHDLENNRLDVTLLPSTHRDIASRGGMRRAVVSKNPAWYRQLCASYTRVHPRPYGAGRLRKARRSPDTILNRRDVLAVLYRLAEGQPSTSRLVPFLTRVAASHVDDTVPLNPDYRGTNDPF